MRDGHHSWPWSQIVLEEWPKIWLTFVSVYPIVKRVPISRDNFYGTTGTYTVVKVLEKDTSMSSSLESFIKEIIINVKLVHCKMCVWLKLVIPDTNFQPVKTFKLLAQGWPALEATYCLIVVVSHFLSLISVVRGLSGSGRGLSRHGLSRLGLHGLGFSVRPKFGIGYSIGQKYRYRSQKCFCQNWNFFFQNFSKILMYFCFLVFKNMKHRSSKGI